MERFIIKDILKDIGFPSGLAVENPPAMQETWVQSLGLEDPLEEDMPTHSSNHAWRIPKAQEPDRLQFSGSQRVWHNWSGWTPHAH